MYLLADRGRVSDMTIMSLFDRAGLLALVRIARDRQCVDQRIPIESPRAAAPGRCSSTARPSARNIGPAAYIGRYECNDRWTSFNLTITETVRGTTAAEAILPLRYIRVRRGSPRANEPTKMQGRVDPASASLTLRTNDEVQLGGERAPNRNSRCRVRLTPPTDISLARSITPGAPSLCS